MMMRFLMTVTSSLALMKEDGEPWETACESTSVIPDEGIPASSITFHNRGAKQNAK
jgi:hypothetical protein